jgi:hypothetical protein
VAWGSPCAGPDGSGASGCNEGNAEPVVCGSAPVNRRFRYFVDKRQSRTTLSRLRPYIYLKHPSLVLTLFLSIFTIYLTWRSSPDSLFLQSRLRAFENVQTKSRGLAVLQLAGGFEDVQCCPDDGDDQRRRNAGWSVQPRLPRLQRFFLCR